MSIKFKHKSSNHKTKSYYSQPIKKLVNRVYPQNELFFLIFYVPVSRFKPFCEVLFFNGFFLGLLSFASSGSAYASVMHYIVAFYSL